MKLNTTEGLLPVTHNCYTSHVTAVIFGGTITFVRITSYHRRSAVPFRFGDNFIKTVVNKTSHLGCLSVTFRSCFSKLLIWDVLMTLFGSGHKTEYHGSCVHTFYLFISTLWRLTKHSFVFIYIFVQDMLNKKDCNPLMIFLHYILILPIRIPVQGLLNLLSVFYLYSTIFDQNIIKTV